MTYAACKKLIENGTYDKEDMTQKLDLFLLGNRITKDEYKELMNLIFADNKD